MRCLRWNVKERLCSPNRLWLFSRTAFLCQHNPIARFTRFCDFILLLNKEHDVNPVAQLGSTALIDRLALTACLSGSHNVCLLLRQNCQAIALIAFTVFRCEIPITGPNLPIPVSIFADSACFDSLKLFSKKNDIIANVCRKLAAYITR